MIYYCVAASNLRSLLIIQQTIQVRGAAVIKARQMSSAMSAAKAAADHMKDIWQGTPEGEFVSMGVVSDGSYGIAKDVVFSFPVTIQNKTWKIVQVSVRFVFYSFFRFVPSLRAFLPQSSNGLRTRILACGENNKQMLQVR